MKRIVTLTMNPALDKSTTVGHIVPDHKLRCKEPKFDPGGGGVNVSRAIKRLGGETLAVFPAGGYVGAFYKEILEEEGVSFHALPIKGHTRENFIVVDETTGQQYRFGMEGPELSESEAQQCLDYLRNLDPKPDYIVASGSLPPGVKPDFIAKVARLAHELKARFVADTSGEALRVAAHEGVYLLKPNLGELSKLAGVEEVSGDEVGKYARQIIDRGTCEVVVVSLGPAGALLVSKDEMKHVPAPTVKKKSTVGAGDSMVAGMVYSLAQDMPLKEVVRFGVACGTAATMNAGTELFKKADVEKLYNWLKSQE
jgi:6-phosphofructokinase 2